MNAKRLRRTVVTVPATLVATGVLLAGIVTYDLDYELLGEPAGSSHSGTNTVCLPYASSAEDASDLLGSISPTPTCVLKFDRESDGHIRFPLSIAGLPSSHPCFVEDESTDTDDFALLPGEGYRVVLDSGTSVTYTITGDEDPEAIVSMFKVGETTPEGPSVSGLNDYCPPYNRAVDLASTLWNEIECPLGKCSNGVCTQSNASCLVNCTSCFTDAGCPGETCHASGFCTVNQMPCPQTCEACDNDGQCAGSETCETSNQLCVDGANDGEFCNILTSISRFNRSDDTGTTYIGAFNTGDFSLASGESYRIQVRRHVDYLPGAFGDIDVYIESQRPAPCGFADGGLLLLENRGYALVDVDWHGGDPEREQLPVLPDDNYTNLVFLPEGGPMECGLGPGSTCAQACPVAANSSAGCEEIGQDCADCGCKIIDGIKGVCKGSPGSGFNQYIACESDAICIAAGGAFCQLAGYLGPGDQSVLKCDQVHCGSGGNGCGYTEGTNCCDQDFQDSELCNNPDPRVCSSGSTNAGATCFRLSDCPGGACIPMDIVPVHCTVVQPGYRAFIDRVSLDGGTTWLDETDLADRGVVLADLPVEPKNCCEFRCDGGDDPCSECTKHSDCDPDGTCSLSACEGSCEDSPYDNCKDTSDCPENGRCVSPCP